MDSPPTIVATPLPRRLLLLRDLAPLPSGWLALTDGGRLHRFDPGAGTCDKITRVELPDEINPKIRPRLSVSGNGRFAAVVNDYGRFGAVVDLTTGKVTLELDGGDRQAGHVPFAVAFTGDRVVHRTGWDRLDISDAATGRLLTGRDIPDHRGSGYRHGALHVSPGGRWLGQDGGEGTPAVLDLRRWLAQNPWESDDGPSRRRLCHRPGHEDVPMCWIGDDLFAVSGLGDAADRMRDGVRIFDATTGDEVGGFAGPRGALFSAGGRLHAAAPDGLEIWDPFTGERTGRVPGFRPAHHHRAAGELAEIRGDEMLRWSIHERLLDG